MTVLVLVATVFAAVMLWSLLCEKANEQPPAAAQPPAVGGNVTAAVVRSRPRVQEQRAVKAVAQIRPLRPQQAKLAARTSGAGIYRGSSYVPTEEDERFTAIFEEAFGPHLEEGFYTAIAGASHTNDDGTHRRRIIRECAMGERLDLIHETQNSYDKNAVAVKRATGEQLGYLARNTAQQVVSSLKHGMGWTAYFRKQTHLPETGKTAGAIILLLCCRNKSADPLKK